MSAWETCFPTPDLISISVLFLYAAMNFDPVCRPEGSTGMAKGGGTDATDGGCKLVPQGQRKYAGS